MSDLKEDLKIVAEAAEQELKDATAIEALEWTARTFGDNYTVASNMQDAVLIDLAAKVKPNFDVLFLETGYHFPETIGVRDAVGVVYPDVRIVNAAAEQSVEDQEAEFASSRSTTRGSPVCAVWTRPPARTRRSCSGTSATVW